MEISGSLCYDGSKRNMGRECKTRSREMVIHEYGSHDNPWILLLHPMMTDHTFMLQFVEGMQEDYYVIAPD